MQFILEQQARLEASAGEHDERIAKNEVQIAAVIDLVGRLAQAEIRLVERMEGLAEGVEGVAERTRKLEDSQEQMRSAMARLFERMDRFIQGLEGDGHKPR